MLQISRRTTLLLGALLLSVGAGSARAQHEHGGGNPSQLGRVNFPTSCNAAAQKEFEPAVAMLHSFWFEESAKAFAKVTELDPGCAMGEWGVAMSLWHELWLPYPDAATLAKGEEAVEKAQALRAKTARERNYIAAIGAFYNGSGKLDHRTRALAYEKAMEQVHQRYPDDHEAAAFYALSLIATALPTDKTYANQIKAGAILEKLFAEEPDHPGLAHYIIHAYDYPPLASRALPAARRYAQIAPAAPHALHMPSHIFTRLGLWQDSVNSNLASYAAAKAYEAQTHMEGAWDQKLHAMDYLEYAYLQQARDGKAHAVEEESAAIQKAWPATITASYAFAAIPARYAVERGDWKSAAALEPRAGLPASMEAITYFARAIGAARSGATAQAEGDVAKLSELHEALIKARDATWTDQVEIQRLAARAWLLHAQGHNDEAMESMRAAAGLEAATEKHPTTPGGIMPAAELLGDLLLEVGQPAAALGAYETSLESSPNRFHGLYGAAHAAKLSNEPAKAKKYFAQLLELAAHADGERPELKEAKVALAQ